MKAISATRNTVAGLIKKRYKRLTPGQIDNFRSGTVTVDFHEDFSNEVALSLPQKRKLSKKDKALQGVQFITIFFKKKVRNQSNSNELDGGTVSGSPDTLTHDGS